MFQMQSPRRLGLISFLIFCTAVSGSSQTTDPHLDALANQFARAAGRLLSAENERNGIFPYLVLDIREPGGTTTALGVRLADALSDALQNRLPGMTPVDRSKLRNLCFENPHEPEQPISSDVALWLAQELGAHLVVLGSVESRGERFNLHLRILDQKTKGSADAGEWFDWTEQMREWQKIPAAPPPRTVPWKDVPSAPGHGFGEPRCIHCPNPAYTAAASTAGTIGGIAVEVLIGEDGRVLDAFPITCLPFGLTEQSVATLKTWQFQPVTDSEGKAAKVHVTIEVHFSISRNP